MVGKKDGSDLDSVSLGCAIELTPLTPFELIVAKHGNEIRTVQIEFFASTWNPLAFSERNRERKRA